MARPDKLIISSIAAAIAACAVTFPYHDPTKPHRAAEAFRNNYPHADKGSFWRWKWEQLRRRLPANPEDGYRFAQATPQLAVSPAVTWVGHATVLLRVSGRSVLTDPQFSERASPVSFAGPRRVVPPVPALSELPHIDVVVISHNHYDHLDEDSVRRLAEQPGGSPRFYVPLGLEEWFARRGIHNVVEMDWWESASFAGLTIDFVPVQHWSKRTLTDTNQSLWGAWVIRHPELSFFFAGDSGYSKDFADIGAKFGGFDVAAIPIGAYAPRWFMQIMHLDPAEAIRVHRDVKARRSIAIHWGTFANLTDESLYEPPLKLAEERQKAGLSERDFVVLRHGETLAIEKQVERTFRTTAVAAE